MPDYHTAIMIVDDARFSSAVITRLLRKQGYEDLRSVSSASEALRSLEDRRASILIADWIMPQMDGLELAGRVRQLDELNHHFTYILLLTAKEGASAMIEAFDRGVDDFVNKGAMTNELLPRVHAGSRIANMQNSLLAANQLLLADNQELASTSRIDPASGLGNARQARIVLENSLSQLEGRGGAISYVCMELGNWDGLKQQYTETILDELASGIGRRLRNLCRPLDTVARVQPSRYVLILHHGQTDPASSGSYRRIHDGINLKAFRTTAGYISVSAATGVVIITADQGPQDPAQIESAAETALQQSRTSRAVALTRFAAATD